MSNQERFEMIEKKISELEQFKNEMLQFKQDVLSKISTQETVDRLQNDINAINNFLNSLAVPSANIVEEEPESKEEEVNIQTPADMIDNSFIDSQVSAPDNVTDTPVVNNVTEGISNNNGESFVDKVFKEGKVDTVDPRISNLRNIGLGQGKSLMSLDGGIYTGDNQNPFGKISPTSTNVNNNVERKEFRILYDVWDHSITIESNITSVSMTLQRNSKAYEIFTSRLTHEHRNVASLEDSEILDFIELISDEMAKGNNLLKRQSNIPQQMMSQQQYPPPIDLSSLQLKPVFNNKLFG